MEMLSHPARFGIEDAASGEPCVPELYYTHPADCLEYAQAYAQVNPTQTAQKVIRHYAAIEARVAHRLMKNYRRVLAKQAHHTDFPAA